MASIEQTIQELASQFVHNVLQALSGASLQELSALTGAGSNSGRRSSVAAAPSRGRGRGRGRVPVAAPKETPASTRGRRGGRRVRRSSEDVSKLAEEVVGFVAQSGGNVAVSEIAKAIGVSTQDITRPVAIALQEGRIYKEGEKRLTRYYISEGKRRKKLVVIQTPLTNPPAPSQVSAGCGISARNSFISPTSARLPSNRLTSFLPILRILRLSAGHHPRRSSAFTYRNNAVLLLLSAYLGHSLPRTYRNRIAQSLEISTRSQPSPGCFFATRRLHLLMRACL